tara:strand:- start:545 stop:1219 length:675 start_codon:yes stop_codon:yes gene_type:complete
MKRIVLALTVLIFTFAGGVNLVHAKAQKEELYSKDERQTLIRVEDYLSKLTTMKARFRQTAEVYADELKGTFYLNKPGKLRFEYDDPIEDYIVADGTFIYFYDSELESASQSLIGSTMADFLVREKPNLLSGEIEVMDIQKDKKKKLLGLTVRQRENPEMGRLTLIFKDRGKAGLELNKWQVVDARGYITQIELDDIERNVSFKDKGNLFTYVDKDILNPGYND